MKTLRRSIRSSAAACLAVGLLLLITACEPGWGTGGCDPTVTPSMPIAEQYAGEGPYSVTSTRTTDFRIYHPRQMDGYHPIITWGNGTGAPTMGYSPLLNHLASWGFVVIASDSAMTGSGDEMRAGVDYLIAENQKPASPFHGMLDTGKIGATGHSQGGGGAINAATDPRITCAAPLAPSPGEIRNVKGPLFLVAGADDTLTTPGMIRLTSYNRATVPTFFGIAKGMDHMSFVGNGGAARGYVTAWFMYYLQNDIYAGEAFLGRCEICNDANWEVSRKNYP
ncbi:MAG: hypothetical protein KFF50_08630 [Desulfatitalea sp.]|nr:hypothetical protein [Desulfatitalea sp.]